MYKHLLLTIIFEGKTRSVYKKQLLFLFHRGDYKTFRNKVLNISISAPVAVLLHYLTLNQLCPCILVYKKGIKVDQPRDLNTILGS